MKPTMNIDIVNGRGLKVIDICQQNQCQINNNISFIVEHNRK